MRRDDVRTADRYPVSGSDALGHQVPVTPGERAEISDHDRGALTFLHKVTSGRRNRLLRLPGTAVRRRIVRNEWATGGCKA